MKSAQELAAWMQVPLASAAERIAAYADPQYHHPLNDAYRQAIIVKEPCRWATRLRTPNCDPTASRFRSCAGEDVAGGGC